MAFIKTIPEDQAPGELAELYRRASNPDGTVDHVMKVHSLSPASLRAHFELYVTAMHRPSPLSRAEREMIGVVVSRLNECEYCTAHHAAGLKRLLPEHRQDVAEALQQGQVAALSPRESAITAFATKVTHTPGRISQEDIQSLRDAGLDDRAILDLVQVVAYFCYANRIATGLGIELERFPIGQHPSA